MFAAMNKLLEFVGYKEQRKNSTNCEINVKNIFLDQFTKDHGTKKGLQLRKVEMTEICNDVSCKVQKLSIGNPSPHHPTKVILLVGATGSGKTTLINAMVNFIFRVDFQDDFRLILIDNEDAPVREQSESQTDLITAYAFNHMPGIPFDYNYVLIDTPGFGDTRGLQRDRELMMQLEYFLKKEEYGIDQVDCVGFVISASDGKLTLAQSYVLNQLSSIFGKDIKDVICIMVTFADDQDPPVLVALKNADVPYKGIYKFNNSSVYAERTGRITEFFWNYGYDSLKDFFLLLGQTVPVSLTLTKVVLEERRQLQAIVVGLHKKIQVGLSKIDTLRQEKEILSRINDNIRGCSNYEEDVSVPKIKKIDLSPNECITNCLKCNFSCHSPCYLVKGKVKEKCAAIKDGKCVICAGHCPWEVHQDMDFKFETTFVKEKRTIQELLDRYKVAKNDSKAKELLIKGIEDDIAKFGKNLLDDIKRAKGHVERLEEIALKPNPMSTSEYIELMIDSEMMQKKENYLTRIRMLQSLKEDDVILTSVREMTDLEELEQNGIVNFLTNLSQLPEGGDAEREESIQLVPIGFLSKLKNLWTITK